MEVARDQICDSCLESFQLIQEPHTNFSVTSTLFIHNAWALFDFDPPVQSLIHQLKYAQRRQPILRLLDYFETEILCQLPAEGYDWILPIPLHPRKQRERGYNQVEGLATWVAHKTSAKVGSRLARRIRYTQSQTKLNAEERQTNLAGAFQLAPDTSIMGSRILIVDDVLTTGATGNALAQVLHEGGAEVIDLLTLSTPRLTEA